MHLRGARVYQFRHSGTSTKTTKLVEPTSQDSSRCRCRMMAQGGKSSGTDTPHAASFERAAERTPRSLLVASLDPHYVITTNRTRAPPLPPRPPPLRRPAT